MTDKPIIFSGPMVNAIIDGRKTMTRRVLKPPKKFPHHRHLRLDVLDDPRFVWWWDGTHERVGSSQSLPYYPGQRLWVRETWTTGRGLMSPEHPIYRADDGTERCEGMMWSMDKWRSPIHMPRWVSRITLIVEDVRVERLQDISEDDARAEGAGLELHPQSPNGWRDSFFALWDNINAKRPGCSWDDNPWVAAITFCPVLKNIDQLGEAA